MGLSDGNLSYGSVTCYITSQLRPGRPLKGLPSVGVYTSTHVHAWVHLYACVWVGLGKLYGLRGSTEVKKGYRIDIVNWMCATRDWVCIRT